MTTLIWFCAVLATVAISGNGQPYVCNDENTMEVCECTSDVCYFKMVIEHLQTFTAYMGTRGRIFYINENGELTPTFPNEDGRACNDLSECTNVHTVDGKTYRSFISVNKQMPGPTLIVNEGAVVVVDVVNSLVTEEISIHWHGIHQINTPWMDGVGYITQCPIEAGTSFRYIFEATPPGTHWYHSHSGVQRTDGLFGALIVKENQIPNGLLPAFEDKPQDHTLTLLDWQREASLELFVQTSFFENLPPGDIPGERAHQYKVTYSIDGAEVGPIPYWSGIINGLGKHENVSFARSRLSVFQVSRGKTYRFRLIGAQSTYAYKFSIDGHKLKLIATDSNFMKPIQTDYIIIHTGERYDFLLTADQRGQDHFLIRAETLEVECTNTTIVHCEEVSIERDALAILTYSNSGNQRDFVKINEAYSNVRHCNESSVCTVTNCPFKDYPSGSGYTCVNVDAFEPLIPTHLDSGSGAESGDDTATWFFNFGFDSVDTTSTINGRNFIFPAVSLQTEQGRRDEIESKKCKDLLRECNLDNHECQCLHIIDIDSNESVRFVLSSLGMEFPFAHPVHFHGHSFRVVKVGYGDYDGEQGRLSGPSSDLDCEVPCKRAPRWINDKIPRDVLAKNVSKTILKDTVIVPAGGYVVIEFLANNPGYWFLHCHIEAHQLEGMALVIREGSEHNSPPEGMTTCGHFTWSVEEFKEKQKSRAAGPNNGDDPNNHPDSNNGGDSKNQPNSNNENSNNENSNNENSNNENPNNRPNSSDNNGSNNQPDSNDKGGSSNQPASSDDDDDSGYSITSSGLFIVGAVVLTALV